MKRGELDTLRGRLAVARNSHKNQAGMIKPRVIFEGEHAAIDNKTI